MLFTKLQHMPQFFYKRFVIFTVAFCAFFLYAFPTHAAVNAPTAPTSTSNVSYNSIQYNWTWGGGTETRFIAEISTSGVSYTVASSSIATSTTNYTFTGLSVNTQYWFRVAAATSSSPTSTYVTSSPVYTLADITTPSVGTSTTSTVALNITSVLNPTSTRYALGIWQNSSGFSFLGYLDQNGAVTGTAVYQTTSTWGANFLARGLSPNVQYAFTGHAINGDGTSSSYDTSLAVRIYTLAKQVDAPTIGTPTVSTIPITINTNGNSASTTYAIQLFANNYGDSFLDATGAVVGSPVFQTNATWGSSFSATGLTENYGYQFAVIARNGNSINAATSSLSDLVYTASNAVSSGGIAIPVSSASQGGVPFNPSPVVSPAPIAVPPVSGVPVSSGLGSVSRVVFTKTLALGSTGAQVVALQQKLRQLGLFTFPTDTGYFGPITKKAVIALQKQHDLKPYPGIVGPLTRALLNSL